MSAPVTHPRLNDSGQRVVIRHPSVPSPLSAWPNPTSTAVVVPDGPMPVVLHGIPLAPAAFRPGRLIAAEPPFACPAGLKPAAGVVIEEPDGRGWVVHPSNGFAGYAATFPKGTVDHGGSLQETAMREAWEESGLLVKLVSCLSTWAGRDALDPTVRILATLKWSGRMFAALSPGSWNGRVRWALAN